MDKVNYIKIKSFVNLKIKLKSMENTEIFVIIMTGKCLVSLIKGPLKKKKEPNKKMHKGHKAPYKRKKYK